MFARGLELEWTREEMDWNWSERKIWWTWIEVNEWTDGFGTGLNNTTDELELDLVKEWKYRNI